MVKVGDRVVIGDWNIPVFVSKVYFEDDDGNEVLEFESVRPMLSLKWGNNAEFGQSKVCLHDKGKVWDLYKVLN